MKTIRKLTYQTGHLYNYYPELTIGGKFLIDKYGWKVGDNVNIKYLKDRIIIKNGGKNEKQNYS